MTLRNFSINLPKVYFEIQSNGVLLGKIIFELRADIVPHTTENFRLLCLDNEGIKIKDTAMSYKGSPFHRVIPKFMCQGGDYIKGDGTSGWSIYGHRFPDENFELKHDQAGVLSMVNDGPNTNGSQFFITFAPCPWLDGKNTAFGKVIEGMDVLRKIEPLGTSSGTTRERILIIDCGELTQNN
jgi:cyclophilin family peptidyl-prolyl cis-trans isomerase